MYEANYKKLIELTLKKIYDQNSYTKIYIEELSSLSNDVYKVTNESQSYILKVFRNYLSEFSNKNIENDVVVELNRRGYFPDVYYVSNYLRLYGFIDGAHPYRYNVDDYCLKSMVNRLADLVSIFSSYCYNQPQKKKYSRKISTMFKIFAEIEKYCEKNHPEAYEVCSGYIKYLLSPQVLRALEQIVPYCMVPTHNDCHFHNILISKDKQIFLIDYEFFALNYRGYELGNFFNEFATNYESFYISEQLYMDTKTKYMLISTYYTKVAPQLTQYYAQKYVLIGRLLSHLFWFWIGVKQIRDPKINIDMQDYVKQRYYQFMKIYEKFSAKL